MIKEPFVNRLGKLLRIERKRCKLRQADLALKANLSAPTVRMLEQGKGNLRSWAMVLDALDVRLQGKNLPTGKAIGQRLAALRKRREISQRELAQLAAVSHPTIVQLERQNRGRLSTLDRVLAILGAGPVLIAKGHSPKFFNHAGNTSGTHLWNTPPELLNTLYSVYGTFDLDPCSPTADKRRAPVRARVHFTAEDDGLNLAWHGQVFLNPPYGREISRWVQKAKIEVKNRSAKTVVALLPARTDTAWWHDHVATDADVVFLRGRLSFGAGGQSAPFPSALILWGGTVEQLRAIAAAIPGAWSVSPGTKSGGYEEPPSLPQITPST